jgi:hypothetical protein
MTRPNNKFADPDSQQLILVTGTVQYYGSVRDIVIRQLP